MTQAQKLTEKSSRASPERSHEMGTARKAADGCLAEVFGYRSGVGEILSGRRAPNYESDSQGIP